MMAKESHLQIVSGSSFKFAAIHFGLERWVMQGLQSLWLWVLRAAKALPAISAQQ